MKQLLLALLFTSCGGRAELEVLDAGQCPSDRYQQDPQGTYTTAQCDCHDPCYPKCIEGNCGAGVLSELPNGGVCYVCSR